MSLQKPTRLKDIATSTGDLMQFDPRVLEIETGHNPRIFDTLLMQQRIDELKSSIRAQGVRNPIMVRYDSGRAFVVDGETRLRAVLELINEGEDIKTIPGYGVKATNEADRLVLALTANTGKPLEQWESGRAYAKLIGYGWTPEQIAAKVGVSVRYVNDALTLADAPIEVTKLVSEGVVTTGAAIAEVKKNGSQAAKTLQDRVVKAANSGVVGPVKRAKKPNSKPYVSLIRELIASVQDEFAELDKKGDEFDYVSVPAKLMRKLVAMGSNL